jgi:hypothetical protein
MKIPTNQHAFTGTSFLVVWAYLMVIIGSYQADDEDGSKNAGNER